MHNFKPGLMTEEKFMDAESFHHTSNMSEL